MTKKLFYLILLTCLFIPIVTKAATPEPPLSSNLVTSMYRFWWNRAPRYDETSFHRTHLTSIDNLYDWLRVQEASRSVRKQSGQDQGIFTLEGQTVSTPANTSLDEPAKFFLILDGQRHRIYDYPTTVAWGLNHNDRVPLPASAPMYYNSEYYSFLLDRFPEGEPLQFSEGPYADYINEMWSGEREEVTEESDIINEFLTNQFCSLTTNSDDLENCFEHHAEGNRYTLLNLFDWSSINYFAAN